MVLTLSPQLEALIREKIASGRYQDADDVMREALELLEERDRFEALRSAVAIGAEEAERGELSPYTPDLLEELTREARLMAREGQRTGFGGRL